MQMTSQGWGYLCDRSSEERKRILAVYAERYIVPMFEQYPELIGKIYLALRKEGFFAYPTPVYNIIVPANIFEYYDDLRLRFMTAHEMLHLVQFSYNIGVTDWNVKKIERQATFMAFARGYAYDFVKAFPTHCHRQCCDMNYRFCYYKCKHIFTKSCKEYSDSEIRDISAILEELAQKYKITDFPDYIKIVEDVLLV